MFGFFQTTLAVSPHRDTETRPATGSEDIGSGTDVFLHIKDCLSAECVGMRGGVAS